MKTKMFQLLLLGFFFIGLSSCSGQRAATKVRVQGKTVVYVKKAPPAPKVVVIKKCAPNKIWVKGHWKWNGRKYVWVKGHCIKKRKAHKWVPGHWKKTPRGWIWIEGHWR
jgi:hypothetical protein